MNRYRLYIDESGDHTYRDIEEPARRYLGLTGCWVEGEDPGEVFSKEISRCIAPKYNRRYSDGRIKGYGRVFLK